MAECNVSRCSHERRIFRRELHKWSKEILYILGLERLAEELMGAWKWKILVQPFSDLESENPVDWYPEETCYFCCAKKQPPYDPASGIIPTIDSYSSLRIDTDEHSTSSDQVKLSGSFISCSSALSPWGALSSSIPSSSPPLDQPLDLSIGTLKQPILEGVTSSVNEIQHSNHISSSTSDSSSLKSVLKVPQIPLKQGLRKRVDANSKRSYTEEELQAALRDIQSGKLGTRRAAVIYGIPRSTLRNKVYKLANESKSRAHCRVTQSAVNVPKKEQSKDIKLNSEIEVPAYDNIHGQNISSASESLRQLLKHTITQKVHSSDKNDIIKNTFPFLTNIDAMTELQMLGSLECSQSLGPVLSHVFSDIQTLALMKSKENVHSTNQSHNALKEDIKLPLLPDLLRRLAEERVEFEKDMQKTTDDVEPDECSDVPSSTQSNVILKVPSFKPAKASSANIDIESPCIPGLASSPPPQTSSHSLSGNKGIAVSLKELIARSLSQRVSCHLKDDEQNLEYQFCTSNVDSQTISSAWGTESTLRDEKETSLNNANNSSNSSDSLKSEKRTRPKRGRYRNYDRDNLARAVRAVQKGEMSVHRAGTFYGVPHSTLEYKVKERHLLRPKKRDAFNNSVLSDATDSTTILKTNNAFPAENNISLKNLKNNLNQISLETSTDTELSHRPAMDSYPSPLSIWQSLPFLSLDFAQLGSDNFFASQMMRKLQENARNHEETQVKQRKEDLGILETLIKTTLEKSVTPDSKSTFILSTDSSPTHSESKKN